MMELSFQAELHSRRDIFRRKDLNKFEAIGRAPLFMKMLAEVEARLIRFRERAAAANVPVAKAEARSSSVAWCAL